MSLLDPARFEQIVRHARHTNPFYARWIPERGSVPILTRQVLQEHNEEILNGRRPSGQTSGSTGVPVWIHMSRERVRIGLREMGVYIREMGGPLPRTDIMIPRSAASTESCISIFTPVPEQVEILQRRFRERGACALITYPSNALPLAQEIIDRGHDFSLLRRLGLISETVDAALLGQLRRAFPNARIWSSYSAVEVGLIAFQCPYEPGFHHAMTGKLGIEILDPDDQPCRPGQLGRVILTDYFNRRMPVIRYDIGDMAASGSCPCGRIPAPALREIVGKVRGCLLHGDGRRIPFAGLSVAFRELPGIRQFQVIQEELERFRVKVAAAGPLDAEIAALLRSEFGAGVQVEIESVDAIPSGPSGKSHLAISRV